MTMNNNWIVIVRHFVAAIGNVAPGSHVSKQTTGEGMDLGWHG